MIYFILALFSMLLEMVVWFNISTQYKGREAIYVSARSGFGPLRRMTTIQSVKPYLQHFTALPMHIQLERVIFIPLDIIITGWLVYIVCSQTFGLYVTCECIGSTWGLGFHGGYVDFLSVVTYKAKGIITYWAAGTAISSAVLLFASVYALAEWLTQSHLSTENYKRAMRGLRRTRTWKKYTFWLRVLLRVLPHLTGYIKSLWSRLQGRERSLSRNASRSLVWAAKRTGQKQSRGRDMEDYPLTSYRTTSNSPMPPRASEDSEDGVNGSNVPVSSAYSDGYLHP